MCQWTSTMRSSSIKLAFVKIRFLTWRSTRLLMWRPSKADTLISSCSSRRSWIKSRGLCQKTLLSASGNSFLLKERSPSPCAIAAGAPTASKKVKLGTHYRRICHRRWVHLPHRRALTIQKWLKQAVAYPTWWLTRLLKASPSTSIVWQPQWRTRKAKWCSTAVSPLIIYTKARCTST